MDWHDLTRPGRMRAWMVEPNRPDSVLGELTGVKWDACSIEAGYYTDTRTTAKLMLHDSNWDARAWIRLTYETDDFEAEVGTYIVMDDPADDVNGHSEGQLSLNSILWGLANRKEPDAWTIGKGTYTSTVLKRLFDRCKCAFSLQGLKEYKATSPSTLERGKSVLEWLFAIANYTGNRVDVTGHGVVTVSKRVQPASISQGWYLDLEDPRGLVMDGIRRRTDRLTTPGRVIVHHQVGSGDKKKDIVAYADATGQSSFANRGYLITDFRSVTNMSPETYQQALKLAQQYLKEQNTTLVEWTINMPSIPVWEGSGITLLPHDAWYKGARPCFVKSLSITDLHLNRPTMKLTLKECASGDKGDENG